jgi:hypothetical protein
MNSIYKTPHGFHIDLGKIVAVHSAIFINKMGHGGWYVSYGIDVQLRDAPIIFTRELNGFEMDYKDRKYKLATLDGQFIEYGSNEWYKDKFYDSHPSILAVHNLQMEVNQIISAWEAFRLYENSK